MGDDSAPPELHSNLAYAQLSTDDVALARASLTRAYFAGADARNPRMVALARLIADAEVQQGPASDVDEEVTEPE